MNLHRRLQGLEAARVEAVLVTFAAVIRQTAVRSGLSMAAVRQEFATITRFILRQPVDARGTIPAAPLVAWLAARYGMEPDAVWAGFLHQMSDEEPRELYDPCLARFTDEHLHAFVAARGVHMRGQPLTTAQAPALAAYEACARAAGRAGSARAGDVTR